MKTYIAQTQPVALGGAWIAIATYDHPRTFSQAWDDLAWAIHKDGNETKSPKRIVAKDGAKEIVVWERKATRSKGSPSSSSAGGAK